ncbi:MAG: 2-amino-4-hydroxy-6-hydroxymethyldihydropteridine diphosphokinase [Ignavibacteria bacterium]|nr:2-amino-4-hydroxy-6-hydroxymethyldihydropteridine diphosphokinase [Ignavibacteria bacterium]
MVERKKEFVLLSLGSNLGERIENIQKAIELLISLKVLENVKISSFYETEPVGYKNQPNFINIAVAGETTLSAEELLYRCKEIEKTLGRGTRPKWREREIDLDIILYGEHTINSNDLQIPHPELEFRKFVLVPANEIASSWKVPNINKTVSEVLRNCKDNSKVVKYGEN